MILDQCGKEISDPETTSFEQALPLEPPFRETYRELVPVVMESPTGWQKAHLLIVQDREVFPAPGFVRNPALQGFEMRMRDHGSDRKSKDCSYPGLQ